MKYITLLLTLITSLAMGQSNFNLVSAPSSKGYQINSFPPISQAVRVFNFKVRANFSTLHADHLAILVPVRTNAKGTKIHRGIIIGTTSNTEHTPCIYPTVYFESFNIKRVYNPASICPEVEPSKLYSISLHVSKDWIAYTLMSDNGTIIDQQALNATERWGALEEQSEFSTYNSLPDITMFLVERKDSMVHIRNFSYGYYLVN